MFEAIYVLALASIPIIFWIVFRTKKERVLSQVAILSVPEDLPEGCFPMKIEKVVDGDTFHVEWIKLPWNAALVGTTIRCAGYDAFEKSKKRRSRSISNAEVDKGKLAMEHFKTLVQKAESACIKPNQPEFDCFGRALGFVHLKIDGKYVDLAAEMKAKGFDRNA